MKEIVYFTHCRVRKVATLRLVDYSLTYLKIIKKEYAP